MGLFVSYILWNVQKSDIKTKIYRTYTNYSFNVILQDTI